MEEIIVSVIQLSVPPALLVPSVVVSVTMVTVQLRNWEYNNPVHQLMRCILYCMLCNDVTML